MKVWIITIGEPLPPYEKLARLWRSALLARALIEDGHEVVRWASTFDHAHKKFYERKNRSFTSDKITYHLLHGVGYKTNISVFRILNHIQVAWAFAIKSKKEAQPDIIVCSFPTIELSFRAVFFAKKKRVPVILDVRDLWPDAFIPLFPKPLKWIGKLILYPYGWMARRALSEATGIISISEGYEKWALSMADRNKNECDAVFKLGYLREEVGQSELAAANDSLIKMGVNPEKKIFWFVGSFGRTIDIESLLEAGRELKKAKNEGVQIVISGAGQYLQYFKNLAYDLDNVIFTGWVNQAQIHALGNMASAGLQPYRQDAPQGLANKLFEYISFGLPILSSLSGENADYLKKYGCGYTYEPGNHHALARSIIRLAGNDALREELAQNAIRVYEQYCAAGDIYKDYAAHIKRLVNTEN